METPDNYDKDRQATDAAMEIFDKCLPGETSDFSEAQKLTLLLKLLKDEDFLREFYLTEQINCIRQYTLLRLIGTGILYAKTGNGPPPNQGLQIGKIKNFHPAKIDALLRDYSRVLDGKTVTPLEGIPPAADPAFEDPFGVGIHNLEKLKSDSFTGEMNEKVKSFYLTDSKTRLVNYMGKLPQNLPVSIQTALLVEILKDLSDPETKIFGQTQKIWFTYSQTCKNVSIDAKFLLYHALKNGLNPEDAKKILGKLIKEFFNAPAGGKNSIHTLINVKLSKAGDLFAELLGEDPKILNHVIECLSSDDQLESAFAVKLLGEYCNQNNAGERLGSLIKNILRNGKACKSPLCVARISGVINELKDKDEVIPSVLDNILDIPALTSTMPVEIYCGQNTNEIAGHLSSEFEILSYFKDDILKAGVERWVASKPASEKLLSELQKITLGDDINKEKLIEDIILKTSLPLIETRRMEMDHIFGKDFVIYIKPNKQARSSLGSWSVRIEFMGKVKDQLTHEFIELDFDECVLTNAPPPGLHDFAEKIGLLIGHKYFVKQKDNSEDESPIIEEAELTEEELAGLTEPEQPQTPEAPAEAENGPSAELQTNAENPPPPADSDVPPSDPAPDSTPPNGDSEPPPSDPRPYGERTEEKITIDIRDHDKKVIEEKQTCVKKTLSENKAAVEALLKGQTDGIDLSKILLHRKTEGEGNGKIIFERVTTDELKTAVDKGSLGEKDWFILNTLPHMKVLPYRFTREHSGKVEDAPEIWLVKKQNRSKNALLAYESYLEAGFPELSPFAEIRASFGILADAEFNPDEYVEIRTENGKSLHIGKTTKKDLNARLAEKMKDPKWMKEWEESQRKILEQESDNTYNENISDDEKLEKDFRLDKEIKDLPDLTEQISKQTSIKLKKNPDEIIASVRLAFGWVPTQTSFNQGHFISIAELKTAQTKSA
jgi:hypothetical protein